MKKIFAILVCLFVCLPASAWTRSFMEKCMNSWLNYPIDDAINYWGYPTSQNEYAGRKIYIWEKSVNSYVPQTATTTGNTNYNFNSYGGYGVWGNSTTNATTHTYGGYNVTYFCNRTLEVDENNKIVRWQWNGNKCPATYTTGKGWVNPNNDEWAREKLAKQYAKSQKKKNKK